MDESKEAALERVVCSICQNLIELEENGMKTNCNHLFCSMLDNVFVSIANGILLLILFLLLN